MLYELYQVELKSAGSWDQFQKPSCTSTPLQFTTSPSPTITFSSWRHHHQPVEFFKKIEDGRGFFDHNAWPPRGLELIQQGLEGFCHSACHSPWVSSFLPTSMFMFSLLQRHSQSHEQEIADLQIWSRGKCYWALAMTQSPYSKPPLVVSSNEWNVSRSWVLEKMTSARNNNKKSQEF